MLAYILANWKTSAAGAALVLKGILGLLGYGDSTTAVADIVMGVGLIFAKDGNITGGSVKQ